MRGTTTRYLLMAALIGALASWSFSAATQAPALPEVGVEAEPEGDR